MEAQYDDQVVDELDVDAESHEDFRGFDVEVQGFFESLNQGLAEQQKQLEEAVVEGHDEIDGLTGAVGVGFTAIDNREILLCSPGLIELLLAASPLSLIVVIEHFNLVPNMLQRIPELLVVDELVEV